jgi:hypothetical protein
MADDYTHTGLEVVGRHVPDEWDGKGENPHDTANPVTGKYQVGVIIEGVFVPIAERKASGLFADIERAKSARASKPDT